jgi:hypothetical protein
LARFEAPEVEWTKAPAVQIQHRVANLCQHPSHDSVFSGMEDQFNDALAIARRTYQFGAIRSSNAILKLNATGESCKGLRSDFTLHRGHIDLVNLERGVS